MEAIQKILEKDLQAAVKFNSGFYFLPSRDDLVARRLENNFYAVKRLKRVARFLKHTRFIPFVDAVALTGSEALSNSKEGSDIDLLVLVQPNRIWLGRLFVSAFFQIFGVRRHDDKVQDRFCLNHYLASNKIIDHDRNIYTAVEYASLIPFFGGEKIYDFQQNNLHWIEGLLHQPEFFKYSTPKSAKVKRAFERLCANRFGDFLENIIGRPQKRRITLREHITVIDDELSFHPGSKGQQVLARFKDSKN